MHTLVVISAGILLLTALIVIGRAMGFSTAAMALLFVPLWFASAAINMWVGVTHAGYSVSQEFPIFIGVFAAPAAIAMIIWWRHATSKG